MGYIWETYYFKSLTDSPGSNESTATVVHKAPTINYVETSLTGENVENEKLIMYSRSTSGSSHADNNI